MRLQLLTWNVHFLPADVLGALRPLADALDVLLLQEVTNSARDAYRDRLASLGFQHFLHSGGTGETKRYGNVVASRHALTPQPIPSVPYPQLLLHARLEHPSSRALHLACVHAPNGSCNGWDKIHTLRGVRALVTGLGATPVVVAGDFNEPRHLPGVVPVRSFAWRPDRDWEELRHRGWERANARGGSEREPRESWDAAVRWFFDESSGLQHAYWATRGVGEVHESHRTNARRAPERWFDHIFVSRSARVIDAAYRDELRRPERSDHSGLWADIDV